MRQLEDSDEEEEEEREGSSSRQGEERGRKEEPDLEEEDLTQERDVFGDSDDEDLPDTHLTEGQQRTDVVRCIRHCCLGVIVLLLPFPSQRAARGRGEGRRESGSEDGS